MSTPRHGSGCPLCSAFERARMAQMATRLKDRSEARGSMRGTSRNRFSTAMAAAILVTLFLLGVAALVYCGVEEPKAFGGMMVGALGASACYAAAGIEDEGGRR